MFFKKSGAVEGYQQLADLVLESATSYGLCAVIQFRCIEDDLNFNSDKSRNNDFDDLIAWFKIKGRMYEEA